MKETHTIIVSDVHLGSPVSRAKDLKETLKEWKFKRLILLGDIFDDMDFNRLTTDHWDFLSYVRELSNPENDMEVVWIKGNHDELLAQIASAFLGIDVHKEYTWDHAGKKHLAIHGHQFDRFLINNKVMSDIASFLYLMLQRVDMKKRRLSRFVKRLSKKWLRLSNKVSLSAIRYGKRKKADYVFCGHTHLSVEKKMKDIRYFNSGCWTDIPSTFIEIKDSGKIEIHKVS